MFAATFLGFHINHFPANFFNVHCFYLFAEEIDSQRVCEQLMNSSQDLFSAASRDLEMISLSSDMDASNHSSASSVLCELTASRAKQRKIRKVPDVIFFKLYISAVIAI